MITSIAQIARIVREYDDAKHFYCETLGFKFIEDLVLPGKRWVRAPTQSVRRFCCPNRQRLN